MQAFNAAALAGATSTTFNFATNAVPTPPSEPMSVVQVAPSGGASSGGGTVTISWQRPLDLGGDSLRYYEISLTNASASRGAPPGFAKNGSVVLTAAASPVTVAGMLALSSYNACVRAVTVAAGTTGAYTCATVSTGAAQPPSAPTGARAAVAASGRVDITWGVPTQAGGALLEGYKVLLRNPLSGQAMNVSVAGGAWTTLSVTTPPIPGLYFDVWVFAVSTAGVGSPSIRTSFSLELHPGAPLNVVISVVHDTSAVVEWKAPNAVPGVTFIAYSVRVSNAGGATLSQQRVNASVGSVTLTGLFAGSTVQVAVAAHNSSGGPGAARACGTLRVCVTLCNTMCMGTVSVAGTGPWVSDTASMEIAANTTTFRAQSGSIVSGAYPANVNWTFHIAPGPGDALDQMRFQLSFVLFDIECDNDKVAVEYARDDGSTGVFLSAARKRGRPTRVKLTNTNALRYSHTIFWRVPQGRTVHARVASSAECRAPTHLGRNNERRGLSSRLRGG